MPTTSRASTQDESDRLLRELVDFACQPPRIYHHDWTPGDAVVWDNRCLMHQATPWDMTQRRIMWHSRIAGDPASESAQRSRNLPTHRNLLQSRLPIDARRRF